MFRELRALGELQVEVDLTRLPHLEQLNAENCHLAWFLRLESGASRAAIDEVFNWAEGDCVLEIEPPEVAAEQAPSSLQLPAEITQPRASQADAGAAAPVATPEMAGIADASSLRVGVDKIDDLMNNVSELVITQSMLRQFAGVMPGSGGERLRAGLAQLERNVRELQESVMRVRMVPISFVFSRFPRTVRDLAQRLGKLVDLHLSGGDTELDKTVLEKIGDPLVHLVRNSVDHGIETPAQRRAAGKGERGSLQLHAYHRGSNIMVEVLDDGAGLNRARILAKARERGLIAAHAEPAEREIDELIFLPGFSTVDQATDVSGRGVGMDVVRRNVESLGGGHRGAVDARRGCALHDHAAADARDHRWPDGGGGRGMLHRTAHGDRGVAAGGAAASPSYRRAWRGRRLSR